MTNTERIAEYIAKGCKKPGKLGLELEHFIVRRDLTHVSYHGGVKNILERLSAFYPEREYSGDDLIALYSGEASITIEPAGQLEISIMPCSDVNNIMKIYYHFLDRLKPILDEFGFITINSGYSPRTPAAEMELIPKKRYEFMDRYFKKTGSCGINMMRATASTQLSFDFADERDCIDKLRYANILTPIFALITDNSPVFEGKPYKGRMLRTHIWNNVDSDRCGTVPNLFDRDFGFLKYAEYIYTSPAILITENNEPIYTGETPISELYKNKPLAEHEIEHLLSMFFPDVRLKQYIELRPADSMPGEFAAAYTALIKALFINNTVPDTSGYTAADIAAAKTELMEHGYNGRIYGIAVKDFVQMLFETAEASLGTKEAALLIPLYERIYTSMEKTL